MILQIAEELPVPFVHRPADIFYHPQLVKTLCLRAGIPSLSVLDGWWIEGHVEGATGWAIGGNVDVEEHSLEIASLYDKLEYSILPLFYGNPARFAEVMRLAIALNGSFFNTHRMVSQYVSNAYFPERLTEDSAQGPLQQKHRTKVLAARDP